MTRSLIDYQDSLITGPIVEPLDLDEVKKFLKFGSTSEDTLIDMWIAAARQDFEEQTGRQLMTATWERWLDRGPDPGDIELPHPPLQSVVGVFYDDAAGVEQEWGVANYLVRAPQGPTCERGRVTLLSGGSWPTVLTQSKALRIRYLAGYGDAPGAVPELVKAALLNLVALSHRYRGSDDKPSMAVASICRRFRMASVPTLAPPYTAVVLP